MTTTGAKLDKKVALDTVVSFMKCQQIKSKAKNNPEKKRLNNSFLLQNFIFQLFQMMKKIKRKAKENSIKGSHTGINVRKSYKIGEKAIASAPKIRTKNGRFYI